MNTHPTLGQLIPSTATAARDAIHLAVIPLTAARGMHLKPGEPFALNLDGHAIPAGALHEAIGVVDPFLQTTVRPGEDFYGCLCPGTTSDLHHSWHHHAFPDEAGEPTVVVKEVPAPEAEDIAEVRAFAKRHHLSLSDVIEEASQNLNAECRNC